MLTCDICGACFSRSDNLLRHVKNKHQPDALTNHSGLSDSTPMQFQHPFTMVVSGPSSSGKTEWTRKLFLSSLIDPWPERIIWCFSQWQPVYDELQRRFPSMEFVHGIPDYLQEPRYIDSSKRNVIVFDDLMTEAKCDQRVADLFTKGSHHRNISVVYLTQNVFPQGKACRDIALNTQYLVLFNNPVDRQQVATLAKRIYPNKSSIFMKRFEQATSKPYGYMLIDLKANTPEQDRLRENVFQENITERKNANDEYRFNGKGKRYTPSNAGDDITEDQYTDDEESDEDDTDDDHEDDNISIDNRKRKVMPFTG